METQKLVTIVLVSTLLVVAIAIGISGLSKGGTGLVDSSQSLLDRIFGREQVVVSGDYDEEALPKDSWVPFFGADVEFEIVIKEFDADKQKCKGIGNYFNVEKQDVGWELSYVDFPFSWDVKEGVELLQIVRHNQIHGTLKLNSGYYTKDKGTSVWFKQPEDDIMYCINEGREDEKPFTAEAMVEAIKIHFAEETGIFENENILTG